MSETFRGKTYSLRLQNNDSDAFYTKLRVFADQCLVDRSADQLLAIVEKISKNKRALKRMARSSSHPTIELQLLRSLHIEFSGFTTSVAEHLQELPLVKHWDRTLAASEEQYHLHMLEFELRNRLNAASFKTCDTKLAFLPHCLHDLTADCRSAQRGEDYVCKGCSKVCTINAVSKLLRRHGVRPYIWRTANLRSLFGRLKRQGKRVGVLGIACIPELISGMRMCASAGIDVVGIPLDANRCARWWGEFFPNSVNLRHLEWLLGEDTLVPASSLAAGPGMKS